MKKIIYFNRHEKNETGAVIANIFLANAFGFEIKSFHNRFFKPQDSIISFFLDHFQSVLKAIIFVLKNSKFDNSLYFCSDQMAIIPILLNKKVLFYSHHNYYEKMYLSIKERLLKKIIIRIIQKSFIVISSSDFNKSFVQKYRKENVQVIYPYFKCPAGFNLVKNKNYDLRNSSNKLKLLMIGVVDYRKYRFLLNKKLSDNISITIIGKKIDNTITGELSKYKNVSCLGYVKDINFQDYDMLLNLSINDNVPAVMPEAISSGIPVISRNVGGSSELISSNTGIILEDKQMIQFLKNGFLDLDFSFNNCDYKFYRNNESIDTFRKILLL